MRFCRTLLGLTFVWIATGFASAQPRIPLDYTTFTLDNGLQVFLVEDHSAPVVTINVWYNVGGANDPDGRSGFAHLFEHLMFQGTANLAKDELLRIVDDAGGTFNAYTAVDRTAYHETLPAHQLPLGLWLEADRMASLAVTQTNLDNQRAVVIQEYQQNYTNAPYGMALLDFYTLTYSYEPYRRSPIGAVADVNAATVDEIRSFHETYYVPNNATLVVVGDFRARTRRTLLWAGSPRRRPARFAGLAAGAEHRSRDLRHRRQPGAHPRDVDRL
jgi:zinc protease